MFDNGGSLMTVKFWYIVKFKMRTELPTKYSNHYESVNAHLLRSFEVNLLNTQISRHYLKLH